MLVADLVSWECAQKARGCFSSLSVSSPFLRWYFGLLTTIPRHRREICDYCFSMLLILISSQKALFQYQYVPDLMLVFNAI
jgi:hypothetical protein